MSVSISDLIQFVSLISIALLMLFILVVISANFKKAFFLFLFVFVPVYGLFLNLYALFVLNGMAPPVSVFITAAKDYVWVIILLSFILYIFVRQIKIQLSNVYVLTPLFIFFLYSISSLSKSYDSIGLLGSTLAFRNLFGYIPIFFMTVYVVKDRSDLNNIIKILLFVTISISLYALVQFVFNLHSPYRDLMGLAGSDYSYRYVNGTFLSYIDLSVFLNLMAVLFLSIKNHYSKNHLIWLAIILTIITIIISQSRMGVIVLFISILLLSLYRLVKLKYVFIFLLLLLVGLTASSVFNESGSHRLLSSGILDGRIVSYWPTLLDSNSDNFFWGSGMGMFGPSATKAMELSGIEIKTAYVDSTILTILLNGGIIGLGLFLTFILSFFIFLNRSIKKQKDAFFRDFLKGVSLMILALLFNSIFFNTIDGFPGSIYFWFLIGMSVSVARIRSYPK